MMKLIAITGCIGSGKSVVSRLLRVMGYPVYDCDASAKRLMQTDGDLRAGLVSLFGEETYLPDGTLNKRYLSERLFVGGGEALQKMNALIHPVVARDLQRFCSSFSLHPSSIVFFESAILYESHFDERVHPDFVISVSAPLELRIGRAMSRDKASREQILARINNQMSQEAKDSRADFVVYNDNQHSVISQVSELVTSSFSSFSSFSELPQ